MGIRRIRWCSRSSDAFGVALRAGLSFFGTGVPGIDSRGIAALPPYAPFVPFHRGRRPAPLWTPKAFVWEGGLNAQPPFLIPRRAKGPSARPLGSRAPRGLGLSGGPGRSGHRLRAADGIGGHPATSHVPLDPHSCSAAHAAGQRERRCAPRGWGYVSGTDWSVGGTSACVGWTRRSVAEIKRFVLGT